MTARIRAGVGGTTGLGLSVGSSTDSAGFGHLVRGRTNKQIAQRLGVTDHTVKTQVNRIYEKLEVRNRLDLLTLAIERLGRGVTDPQGGPRLARKHPPLVVVAESHVALLGSQR
jgi:hypothetical protein